MSAPTYQEAGTALLALYGGLQATLSVPMPLEAHRQVHILLDAVGRYFDAHVQNSDRVSVTVR
ncbi:MAG: hypothetical protein H7Y15_04410 [Pseudonocardia sp.]|nr:hypothetical protein [Pseudonocardia sp.]